MIELHRPDGRIITTTITGHEILDPPSIDQPRSILVSDIEEVPPGTDVYLVV
jgi:hypothetical protein